MKIAVFGDVHANLEALRRFVAHSAVQGAERYIFLGDCVGYGPDPNRCVEIISTLAGIEMVMGNHDSTAVGKTSPYNMNTYAREAMFWTMEHLSAANSQLLRGLRLRLVEEDICYVHSSPESPEAWSYLNSTAEAFRAFSATRHQVSFVAHTHWPRIFSRSKMGRIMPGKILIGRSHRLADNARYIINCGSIGQPRDGHTQGCYCIFDDEAKTVVFQRFDYDVDTTIARMHAARLPEFLAVRLRKGR